MRNNEGMMDMDLGGNTESAFDAAMAENADLHSQWETKFGSRKLMPSQAIKALMDTTDAI